MSETCPACKAPIVGTKTRRRLWSRWFARSSATVERILIGAGDVPTKSPAGQNESDDARSRANRRRARVPRARETKKRVPPRRARRCASSPREKQTWSANRRQTLPSQPRRKSATSTLPRESSRQRRSSAIASSVAKMMQGERKEHDVVRLRVAEVVNVRAVIMDLGKSFAQVAARSRSSMPANPPRRLPPLRRLPARELNHQPRDIARAGGEIENTQVVAASNPAYAGNGGPTDSCRSNDSASADSEGRKSVPARPAAAGPSIPALPDRTAASMGGALGPDQRRAARPIGTQRPLRASEFMREISATIPAARPSRPRSRSGLQTRPGTKCWCRKP